MTTGRQLSNPTDRQSKGLEKLNSQESGQRHQRGDDERSSPDGLPPPSCDADGNIRNGKLDRWILLHVSPGSVSPTAQAGCADKC